MEWMINTQLGRRNLPPAQRLAVTEKYRPFYEKRAKQEQGTRNDLQNNFPSNLTESSNKLERNSITDKRLSDIAGVSRKHIVWERKFLIQIIDN